MKVAAKAKAGVQLGSGTTLPGASQLLLNGVLLVLVVGSAFAVVYSTHLCRQLYAGLQVVEARQWYLQEDYGRLLLEQSTWASHHRIEQVAQTQLHMVSPALTDRRLVRP